MIPVILISLYKMKKETISNAIRYPRRVTVNNKRLRTKSQRKKNMHMCTKTMALLRITKGNNFGSYVFIISICLADRNVLARFDENIINDSLRY